MVLYPPNHPQARNEVRLLKQQVNSKPMEPKPDKHVSQLTESTAFRTGGHGQYLRIHKCDVFVRDLNRSVQFYVDQLGFSVLAEGGLGFDRWVAVAPPDGNTILVLRATKPGSADDNLVGRATHVGLIAEDIEAMYQQWLSNGVRFDHPPQRQVWGGAFTAFFDVDGNSFELVESDQISRDIEVQRRAIADRAENERRAARELEIAKQVQARLLPHTLPPLNTLDYAGTCIQARQVGGDYYDFVALGEQTLGLVVGDISGKGIAAALLMANLQANLRIQFAAAREQPRRFLQSVNRLFYENTVDSAYATVFFSEYDDLTGRLRYINCGHLPGLLLRRDDRVEWLHSTGTVLGLFKDWDSPAAECDLLPGDVLALYTDGVTETSDAAGEEFGAQRLVESLRRHQQKTAQGVVESVVADVQAFSDEEQHDDITLVVAKCQKSS